MDASVCGLSRGGSCYDGSRVAARGALPNSIVMLSTLRSGAPRAPPAKARRVSTKTSPFYLELLDEVGGERDGANQQIYLVTVSRVLPGVAVAGGFRDLETLTRQEVEVMVK